MTRIRHFITDDGRQLQVPNNPLAHAGIDLIEHQRRKNAEKRATADGQASHLTPAQRVMVYLHRLNGMAAYSAQLRLRKPETKRWPEPKQPTFAEFCTPKADWRAVTGDRLPNPEHLSGYFEQYFDELLPYIGKVEGWIGYE